MSSVLVISRLFPIINQPWMDTYLEQLLRNNIDFKIYSYNKKPEKYNAKVDELGLRNFQIKFDLEKKDILKSFLKNLLLHPIKTFRFYRKYNLLAKELSTSTSSYYFALAKLLYFKSIGKSYPDISLCHSHTELGSFDFLHLCKALDIPLVITFHGLPPSGVRELDNWKRNVIYQSAKAVFVNTEFAKNQVCSLGCPEDKVIILPQGTPLENFPFYPTRPDPTQKVRILTVGRYHRDKGHHYALLAIARLKASNINLEWNFVGVGPRLDALKKLSQKLDIQNNVIFHEGLSFNDLMSLYQSSHIFVLTSITNSLHVETQSVVVQEAQASGCLVIATAVGGVPECVIDRKNALLVKPSSSRDLSNAIIELYDNVDNWDNIRKLAREHVETFFCSNVIGTKMSQHLNKFLMSEQNSQ